MRSLLLCALALAACTHSSPTIEHPHGAGTWQRAVGHGESQRLTLFPSGIVVFQRLGPELPISRSLGRWSIVDGELALSLARTEPEGREVTIDTSAAWQRVEHPYGTDSGAQDRA